MASTPPTRPEGPNHTPRLDDRDDPRRTVTMPPTEDPLIGVDVGDGYAISSRLASGGMGALYIAQHRGASTKRKAIKVLLSELMARVSPRTREDILHRFEMEARISLNLDHPNVINVDGWGQLPTGALYIKMELLKGKDLRKWARDRHEGTVPADEVLQVLAQVCSALEQAHRLGVVHRDLKPENIFMVEDPDGAIRTKLLDFGIARVTNPHSVPGAGKKTTIPRAMGTPGYWSPEQQTSPGDVDHRADIYALGIIAYELLTGSLPGFGSLAPHQLPPTFPREWYEPIAQALAGNPAQRQNSARDFLAALIDRTPDGATLAAVACPTLFRTGASAADSTIKAPSLAVPGLRNSVPPPASLLPPSTLAQAAGAYGTQATPRRGRLVLAAIGGAVLAAAIAIAIVVATRPGTSSPPSSPAPSSAAPPVHNSTATAPSSPPTTAKPAGPPAQVPGPSSTAAPDDAAAPATATGDRDQATPDTATPTTPTTTRPTTPTSPPPPRRTPRRPPKRTGIERLGQ